MLYQALQNIQCGKYQQLSVIYKGATRLPTGKRTQKVEHSKVNKVNFLKITDHYKKVFVAGPMVTLVNIILHKSNIAISTVLYD